MERCLSDLFFVGNRLKQNFKNIGEIKNWP